LCKRVCPPYGSNLLTLSLDSTSVAISGVTTLTLADVGGTTTSSPED